MALSISEQLSNISNSFKSFVEHPDKYLKAQDNIVEGIKDLIKNTYDITKRIEENTEIENKESLPELLIKGFDDEQIWQQLELQNRPVLNCLLSAIGIFKAKKSALEFFPSVETKEKTGKKAGPLKHQNLDKKVKFDEEAEELKNEESDEGIEEEELDDDELDDENLDDEELDDDELNVELYGEELEEGKGFNTYEKKVIIDGENSEDDEDYDEEEAARELFGKGASDSESDPASKKRRAEDENDSDGEPKSNFEKRQVRLRRKIERLEEEALAEKPWQMQGEVSSTERPKNSLLEEILEYQDTSRPAPIITGETSVKLEDIIRQRIKDQVWDDVERKVKPVKGPAEFKRKLALDQEKSKLSLAEIYEQEFVKQRDALNPEVVDAPEETPKAHEEISKMMSSLFRKLDALSNFHYTPKPAVPELKIINNLPAVTVEEVAPVSMSDAALLAPEEIKRKQKGDLIGKDERTKTDKKRERRKKKQLQKKKQLEKEAQEKEKRSKKAVPDVF